MHSSSSCIITPTARLARKLRQEYAQTQAQAGHRAWHTPLILSWSAWLAQLAADYFLDSEDPRVVMTPAQADVMWQALVTDAVFIGEPQVANLAQQAWRRLHEYQLDLPDTWEQLLLSEDHRHFRSWARAYQRRCQRLGLVDEWAFAAELPDLISAGAIELPKRVLLQGFDLPQPPLSNRVLAALEAAGCPVVRESGPATATRLQALLQFPSGSDELLAAARWARTQLAELQKSGGQVAPRIAVVVPDLGARLAQVERCFNWVFDAPGYTLREQVHRPWHVSLGVPLAHWPVVTDALALLAQPEARLSQPQANRLLRSPFLSGWVHEQHQRSRAMVTLQRHAPFELTANELGFALEKEGATELRGQLAQWRTLRRDHRSRAWPSQWAARFAQELTSVGFGKGRPLDSREYQVLQRWHRLLEDFGELDLVCSESVSRETALTLLREHAGNTVFREQNIGTPVEVLGVAEALGSTFDALWITTLDSDHWPGPPQRDPLIPARVQAAVPQATSEGALTLAQAELQALMRVSNQVQGSYARGSEEIAIDATGLLDAVAVIEMDPAEQQPPAPMAPDLIDAQAPIYRPTQAPGGTAVLRHQSDCPFRAFAEHRLKAVDSTGPRPGLSAGERGTLIHRALERFWAGLASAAELRRLSASDQDQRVHHAVDQALTGMLERRPLLLSPAGRVLEQQRGARALLHWLEVERQRPDFRIIAREQPVTMTLAGLTLEGKLDRLDQLEDGSTLLIDYKTGRSLNRKNWFPEPRIKDPQLPAYAVSLEPHPSAIAFAGLHPEAMQFNGLAQADLKTSGIRALDDRSAGYTEIDSWDVLLDAWQRHLTDLANNFVNGAAQVDPRERAVCTHCHLHALCRVQERAPASDDDPAGRDE